jgi:hypothetical protein
MTAIVYRKLPDIPHRLADVLWMRSRPRTQYRSGQPTEPAGEYGTEEVLP